MAKSFEHPIIQQGIGFSRRTLLLSTISALTVIWLLGIYLTEFFHPVRQIVSVWARGFGPKYHRTQRESETNMAIFHLSKAVPTVYYVENGAVPFPVSWEELIRDCGGYRGSHLRGTLREAFPLLLQPTDPWGRPWVFEIKIVEWPAEKDAPAEVFITLNYGSLGPDHVRCDRVITEDEDLNRVRFRCDDLICRSQFGRESKNRLPPGLIEKRQLSAASFPDHR